ncbi:unnamed protein product [Diplocarpon coronariae]
MPQACCILAAAAAKGRRDLQMIHEPLPSACRGDPTPAKSLELPIPSFTTWDLPVASLDTRSNAHATQAKLPMPRERPRLSVCFRILPRRLPTSGTAGRLPRHSSLNSAPVPLGVGLGSATCVPQHLRITSSRYSRGITSQHNNLPRAERPHAKPAETEDSIGGQVSTGLGKGRQRSSGHVATQGAVTKFINVQSARINLERVANSFRGIGGAWGQQKSLAFMVLYLGDTSTSEVPYISNGGCGACSVRNESPGSFGSPSLPCAPPRRMTASLPRAEIRGEPWHDGMRGNSSAHVGRQPSPDVSSRPWTAIRGGKENSTGGSRSADPECASVRRGEVGGLDSMKHSGYKRRNPLSRILHGLTRGSDAECVPPVVAPPGRHASNTKCGRWLLRDGFWCRQDNYTSRAVTGHPCRAAACETDYEQMRLKLKLHARRVIFPRDFSSSASRHRGGTQPDGCSGRSGHEGVVTPSCSSNLGVARPGGHETRQVPSQDLRISRPEARRGEKSLRFYHEERRVLTT